MSNEIFHCNPNIKSMNEVKAIACDGGTSVSNK